MENAKDTNVAVQAREAYEGKVAIEALERAGWIGYNKLDRFYKVM